MGLSILGVSGFRVGSSYRVEQTEVCGRPASGSCPSYSLGLYLCVWINKPRKTFLKVYSKVTNAKGIGTLDPKPYLNLPKPRFPITSIISFMIGPYHKR